MRKSAGNWDVTKWQNKQRRKDHDVAHELETALIEKANELLNGKHDHWQLLATSAAWVQQQCATAPSQPDNEALMAVLTRIQSWLDMPRLTKKSFREQRYTPQRTAIKAELEALFVKTPNGVMLPMSLDFCSYAFTQHALRDLRARTSLWTETLRASQPRGLLGRAGREQSRAMTSEMIVRGAHWPFHLAGDSGARLFDHRAWVSWR